MEPGGLDEPRTRVTFFLPSRTPAEREATAATIKYLQRQYDADLPVWGFTHTDEVHPAFFGYWWDCPEDYSTNKDNYTEADKQSWWVPDDVVFFIIDYPCTTRDPKLQTVLEELRAFIAKQYSGGGPKSEQDELWIVAERAERFVLRGR